jgi:aryl-alcohol dehydrogenase-like predicted oxidoreductase
MSLASRIGIGTVQFGLDYGISNQKGKVKRAEIGRIFALADQHGIVHIDTASAYGDSEKNIGQFALGRFKITTKTQPNPDRIEQVLARFHQSLVNLNLPKIETLLVHHVSDLLQPDGPLLWRALQGLKEDGQVKAIGFSCYEDDQPKVLAQRFRPDVIQLPVSILDQRLLMDGTIKALSDMGTRIIARSVFLQGLVSMTPSQLPARLIDAGAHILAIQTASKLLNISPIQFALGFVLNHPEIDHAVVGVTSADELAHLLMTPDFDLPQEDARQLACQDPAILDPRRWPK